MPEMSSSQQQQQFESSATSPKQTDFQLSETSPTDGNSTPEAIPPSNEINGNNGVGTSNGNGTTTQETAQPPRRRKKQYVCPINTIPVSPHDFEKKLMLIHNSLGYNDIVCLCSYMFSILLLCFLLLFVVTFKDMLFLHDGNKKLLNVDIPMILINFVAVVQEELEICLYY